MNKRICVAILGGAALFPLATATAAQAADTAASDVQRASESGALGDIVVTAQRRKEGAQTVPVTVTVLGQERLRELAISQPQDLYGSVPSLVVGNQGQASRDVQAYAIRGVATGFLSSPAVAVYLNEVPLPTMVTLALQGGPGQFVDLENVQVLAGPQGTLFGRNTTGGAVLLTPHRPDDVLGGYLEGSVGNYDLRELEGAVNIPVVSDKVLLRVSGAYRDRDGFTNDTIWNKKRDDTHWYSGRVTLLLKPTERFENYLLAYGAQSSTNGTGFVHQSFNLPALAARGACVAAPGVPTAGQLSCAIYQTQTAIAQSEGPRTTRPDMDEYAQIKTWGVINTSDYELSDELKLKNIVSYQELKTRYAADQDGTPFQIQDVLYNAALPNFPVQGLSDFGVPHTPDGTYANTRRDFDYPREYVKELTEELQLQGQFLNRKLLFTIGSFYYDQSPKGLWGATTLYNVSAAQTGMSEPSVVFSGVSSRSHAIYGQATLDLGAIAPALDGLRVTGGYRYTWDRIRGFVSTWTALPGTANATCPVDGGANGTVQLANAFNQCRFDGALRSHAPTWTIGLDYRPAKNLFLYGKVSRGYKSGGFNTVAVRPEAATFMPEKVTTYEIGAKSDWVLGAIPVRLNLAYYYSDYQNIQKPAGDFNPLTGRSGAQILGAVARIQGVEVEATIRPIAFLELNGNFSYTDPHYKSFTQVAPFGATACNGVVPAGGTADYSCVPYAYVNKWIYNINATLSLPIFSDYGNVSLFVNYAHVSSQPTSPTTLPAIEPGSVLEPYGLLKASLDWRKVGGSNLDISLFGTNLTDALYRTSNSNVYGSSLHWATLYGEPRMYGMKVRYSF